MPPEPAPRASDRGQRTLRALADRLLEEHRVEYIDDGALTVMPPAGFTHARILEAIIDAFHDAKFRGLTTVRWALRSENFQFDLVDGPQKFFIPDLAIAHPGSTSNREFRENLAMVVEVTSPESPQTVRNDHGVKPTQYAKAAIPCYLLVDQEQGTWTVYVLDDDRPGYRIHGTGRYGNPIKLPAPFEFAIPTDEWPAYREDAD
jgi:Uma2 family endonuclease